MKRGGALAGGLRNSLAFGPCSGSTALCTRCGRCEQSKTRVVEPASALLHPRSSEKACQATADCTHARGCVLLPAKCTARSRVKSNAAGRALAGQRRGAAARANHRVWSAVSVRRRVMVNDRPGTDPKRSRQIGRSRGHATCRLPWAALRGVEGLIPALRFQKEGGRRGRASGARRAAS